MPQATRWPARGRQCEAWSASPRLKSRWACAILPEGLTTPVGGSCAGCFAFLDVRYEKSENGFPWASYGVGKAKGQASWTRMLQAEAQIHDGR
jgi:hypothetical protein